MDLQVLTEQQVAAMYWRTLCSDLHKFVHIPSLGNPTHCHSQPDNLSSGLLQCASRSAFQEHLEATVDPDLFI